MKKHTYDGHIICRLLMCKMTFHTKVAILKHSCLQIRLYFQL